MQTIMAFVTSDEETRTRLCARFQQMEGDLCRGVLEVLGNNDLASELPMARAVEESSVWCPRGDSTWIFEWSTSSDGSCHASTDLPGTGRAYGFRVLPSGERVLWCVADESAALKSKGVEGRGLYAARDFTAGEVIGLYVGEVLGLVGDMTVHNVVEQLPESHPYDAILAIDKYYVDGKSSPFKYGELRAGSGGGVLFPQSHVSYPGMAAYLMNDAHGCTRGLFGANVEVTDPHGVVRCIVEAVPAFNISKPFHENPASELLWLYGERYWGA